MYSLVMTTTKTLKEARTIVKGLLGKKWMACANILGPIESHFVWKGKSCKENEYLVLIKTVHHQFSKIRDFIVEHHSYESPEVISVPIHDGLDKYLSWVNDNSSGS